MRAAWAEQLGWFERERFPPLPSDTEASQQIAAQQLALPAWRDPRVSVIVPVYGKFATTWACLRSLCEVDAGESFEVIVADDCSTDATPQMLERVRNLRVIRNQSNLGYLRSNNHAAQSARGSWLCLLNNDTRVTAGWLSELVNTFEHFDRVGLVGSKLLFGDGRLQEAGGVVFDDASCANYGRWTDPERPEYGFARRVDYCSAASVLLPRDLWASLGGFDERFAPAYYEDTDLAFRVRRAGLQVMYQPLSRVVHYHGVTHGRSVKRGLKRSLIDNRRRFAERWRDELLTYPAPTHAERLAAERRQGPGFLLVLEREPRSVVDPEFAECLALAFALARAGNQVTLWPREPARSNAEFRRALGRRGVELLLGGRAGGFSRALGERADRFRVLLSYRVTNEQELLARARGELPHARRLAADSPDGLPSVAHCASLLGVDDPGSRSGVR